MNSLREFPIYFLPLHSIFDPLKMSDITLKITDREGTLFEVEAPTDMNMSLMEVIRAYAIAEDGEIGVCGGMAMCGSCQCYVQNDVPLPEIGADEEAMLFETSYTQPNSRLGCQIPITEELNGLEVILAPYP